MPTPTSTEATPTRTGRSRGVTAALALLPAVAPLGVAIGVALGGLSISPVVAWLSAPLMVAGASQLVLFTQIDSGAPVLAAALAAILLNGRFVIYGAALAGRFSGQPGWFTTIGSHYVVDQSYALVLNDIADSDDDEDFRHYFLTAGTILWVAWSCAVGIGILVGPVLPPQLPLEFVLPASFVALIAPTVTRSREVAAVVAGAVAGLLVSTPSSALLIAAIAGAAVSAATAVKS